MKKGLCPNCETPATENFYQVNHVPVHNVMLMTSREEAEDFPKGNITLSFCHSCGFIYNSTFDPHLMNYSGKCEETQGFSETFNKFHHTLAKNLVEKYGLYNKRILEIGCGKGDFITLVCELGDNTGYGFDPAFLPERNPDKNNRVRFIADLYSEKYAGYQADFICCKMTLEHIPDTLQFLRMVRKAIGEQPDAVVFFQIPNAGKVMDDLAFWDVYYEHCSYFSSASLEYLFRRAGFEVLRVMTAYEDQYLMMEAKPMMSEISQGEIEPDVTSIRQSFEKFRDTVPQLLERWIKLLQTYKREGKKVVLWGGGSKAVAFVTTLRLSQEIEYAVDINPFKQGHYLPGSGQKVIAPSELVEYRPDKILLLNPIYEDEVRRKLHALGLEPEILPVDLLSKEPLTMAHG